MHRRPRKLLTYPSSSLMVTSTSSSQGSRANKHASSLDNLLSSLMGESILVVTVSAKTHEDATSNQYQGSSRCTGWQVGNMKLRHQEAGRERAKQDQSSRIPHQPADRDGCTQKKLKREGEFGSEGELKDRGESTRSKSAARKAWQLLHIESISSMCQPPSCPHNPTSDAACDRCTHRYYEDSFTSSSAAIDHASCFHDECHMASRFRAFGSA